MEETTKLEKQESEIKTKDKSLWSIYLNRFAKILLFVCAISFVLDDIRFISICCFYSFQDVYDKGLLDYLDYIYNDNDYSPLLRLKDEALYIIIPFGVASIIICFIRRKCKKFIAGMLFGILIFCLQLIRFEFPSICWDKYFLLFIMDGVINAMAYGGVLFYSLNKIMLRGRQFKSKLIATLVAHLFACLTALASIIPITFVLSFIIVGLFIYGFTSGTISGILSGGLRMILAYIALVIFFFIHVSCWILVVRECIRGGIAFKWLLHK